MYEIKANEKHTSLGMLLTAQKLINKALFKKRKEKTLVKMLLCLTWTPSNNEGSEERHSQT